MPPSPRPPNAANLITATNHGRGARVWESSGDGAYGPHAAALTTFWNAAGTLSCYYPPPDGSDRSPGVFGPMINFLWKSRDVMPQVYGWFSEPLHPRLHPPNLHASMVKTRRARLAL